MFAKYCFSLPISGVLLETGNISETMVANIVIVSIIATPETDQTFLTVSEVQLM